MIIDFAHLPIGDSVVNFSQLRALKSYQENACIDLCTTAAHYPILKNNPIPRQVFFDFTEVDYAAYDLFLLFCGEEEYLVPLAGRYSGPESKAHFTAGVFSLLDTHYPKALPLYQSFLHYQSDEYVRKRSVVGQELFVSRAEKAWATDFLREKGVQEDEKVIVLLDSASQAAHGPGIPVIVVPRLHGADADGLPRPALPAPADGGA